MKAVTKITKFCKELTKIAKTAKIAKFCKNRYRNINEGEGGPSTKLRNLRKSRNFAKMAIGI